MSCTTDQNCPFLYMCQQSECIHDQVFPLQVYPSMIYLLLPFACGLVNSTGQSMGIFRVLIVMSLLRYGSDQATMITQAMVIGSAIPNFVSVILRKHPELPTSLVNYNLILLLVPSSSLGSTFGSLVGSFLPVIGSDVMIILVFTYFSRVFYVKYRKARIKEKQHIRMQQQQRAKQSNQQDDNEADNNFQAFAAANMSVYNQRQSQLQQQRHSQFSRQSQKKKQRQGQLQQRRYSQLQSRKSGYRQSQLQHRRQSQPNGQSQKQKQRESHQQHQQRLQSEFQSRKNNENVDMDLHDDMQKKLKQDKNDLKQSLVETKYQNQLQISKPNKKQMDVATIRVEQNQQVNHDKDDIDLEIAQKVKQEVNLFSGDQEYEKLMQYQKSYHMKDVFFSIGVFLLYEFLVFLVQGKLPFLVFSRCTWQYPTGLAVLTIFTFMYMFFIKKYLKLKFDTYDKYKIYQEISLNKSKQFFKIVATGCVSGFIQGMLGLGSGACLMSVLLSTPINAISGAATSGYQILFDGSSSLVQGFIDGTIQLENVGFYIGVCCVLGGGVTFFIVRLIKRGNQLKIAKIMILLIDILCVMSVVMIIPSIVLDYLDFGWEYLIQFPFSCQ